MKQIKVASVIIRDGKVFATPPNADTESLKIGGSFLRGREDFHVCWRKRTMRARESIRPSTYSIPESLPYFCAKSKICSRLNIQVYANKLWKSLLNKA